ncbi:outer membrane protein [Legionella sp. D16C41]|uniref:outer membrane protein n=1 Tax=Legionella sp. D16C41 TaxID=3402688 RepID=UPI003AF6F014
MNLIRRLSIISTLLVSTTTFAADPDDGWYAGLLFGASFLNNIGVNFGNNFLFNTFGINLPNTTGPQVDYSIGGDIAGQVGYRWCGNYRFEGELYFNFNPIEKLQIPTLQPIRKHQNSLGYSLKGSTGLLAGFFNAYYDFYTPGSDSNFVPYIGLGIGYAYFRTSVSLYYLGTYVGGSRFQDSTTTPIGQGILGASYFIDETLSIGLDFRYLTTRNISDLNGRVTLESINFLINFGFDQPE